MYVMASSWDLEISRREIVTVYFRLFIMPFIRYEGSD